jgi:hypothetical protein
MTSKDVKAEILNGIFRSKDGLSTNELTELLNTLIEVSKLEGQHTPPPMDEIIKRVEGLEYKPPASDLELGFNCGCEIAIQILRSTPQENPTIKAKALKKKGTDEWYEYDPYRMSYIISDMPEPDGTIIMSEDILPADAELVNITIIVE